MIYELFWMMNEILYDLWRPRCCGSVVTLMISIIEVKSQQQRLVLVWEITQYYKPSTLVTVVVGCAQPIVHSNDSYTRQGKSFCSAYKRRPNKWKQLKKLYDWFTVNHFVLNRCDLSWSICCYSNGAQYGNGIGYRIKPNFS